MGISLCGKIRRAFIEFLGYDLKYLKSGVYYYTNYKNLCSHEICT